MIESEAQALAREWVNASHPQAPESERAAFESLSSVLAEAVPDPDAWMIHQEGPAIEILVLADSALYRAAGKGQRFAVYRRDLTEPGFEVQLEQGLHFAHGADWRTRRWILGDGFDNIVVETEQRIDADVVDRSEAFAVAVARAAGWSAFDAGGG